MALKVALVHDWLNQHGGAERVLEHLVDFFPGAPIYTSIYWRERLPASYQTWDIRVSWMDRLPAVYRRHQWYFPFYALAFARLNLGAAGYDVILSNKSGFCHGVRTGDTPQLCYCLAPTRYVWEYEAYAAREQLSPVLKAALRPFIAALRRWDFRAAQRPTTHFVAISTEIQARIRRYYQRDATIIYPPVELGRFKPAATHGDYYFIASRLVPYKRIDLAVTAFTQLGLPLVIAGEGRDRPALEALAGPQVRFLGRVSDAELSELLAGCRAFIFPGREDFGIAPLEAQAAGRPVIAYGAGGALDTIIEGETGVFFHEPTAEALAVAVRAFDAAAVDPAACRANAERFAPERFRAALLAALAQLTA